MEDIEVIHDRETALRMLGAATAIEDAPRFEPRGQRVMTVGSALPRSASAVKRAQERERPPCRCGVCKACADNARWERIFREKFADAGYYSELRLRRRSALADL